MMIKPGSTRTSKGTRLMMAGERSTCGRRKVLMFHAQGFLPTFNSVFMPWRSDDPLNQGTVLSIGAAIIFFVHRITTWKKKKMNE